MKVNQTGPNSVPANDSSSAKGAERANSAQPTKKTDRGASSTSVKSSSSSIPGAQTEISAKGKEFAKTRALAAQAPDVREDKIAELKQRIESGSYKIDANAIGDKLVDEHLRSI